MSYGQYSHGSGRVTVAESFAANTPSGIIGKPKRIGHNRFRYDRKDGATVFRLRETDIVITYPDGRTILDSGGWKTSTTRSAMNEVVTGYSVFTKKGIWYVKDSTTRKTVPFFDGMELPKAFEETPAVDVEAQKALINKINKFCKLADKGYDAPNAGDCWLCAAERGSNHDAGTEHLLHHLEEGYLHGTLIYNALKWAGYQDSQMPFVFTHADTVKRALRRYLRRRLGIS